MVRDKAINLAVAVVDRAKGGHCAAAFQLCRFALGFGLRLGFFDLRPAMVLTTVFLWSDGQLNSVSPSAAWPRFGKGIVAVGGIWSLQPNSLRQNPDMAFPSVKMGSTHALLTGN